MSRSDDDQRRDTDRTLVQPPAAPGGGPHPEQPTGGPGGRSTPEAGRATFETANESPSPLPDEPLPPQD